MAYQCVTAPLVNVRPHPNAQKLNLATVLGYQVVVGLNNKDGDLGLFFDSDGVLSREMASKNNLYSNSSLNDDTTKKGYFSDPARVKAQKFRGEKSYGFWIEVDSVAWTGVDLSTLVPGFGFTHLNGHEVCRKYINPATRRMANRDAKAQKLATRIRRKYAALKEHFDTAQLRRDIGAIQKGSILYLTSKCHGTSGRTGNLPLEIGWLEEVDLSYHRWTLLVSLLAHLPGRFGRKIRNLVKACFSGLDVGVNTVIGWLNRLAGTKKLYDTVTGTRRVVLDPGSTADEGYYSGKTFRIDIHRRFKGLCIKQGYTFFYEICGYDETGEPIMGAQPVEKIEDKKIQKEIRSVYGDVMRYSYGCDPLNPDHDKRYRVLVYRVTMSSPDGTEVELSWPQVKEICSMYGLEVVPDLAGPIIYDGNQQTLLELVESFLDKPEGLDPSHVREGVCVRAEMPNGKMVIQKDKGFIFKALEFGFKSDPDAVDVEEQENLPAEETPEVTPEVTP